MRLYMKQTILLAVACLFSQGLKADEGMWTLYDLPDAVYDIMTGEGLSLEKADLYQSGKAVSRAVVNFSGYCSGVVVSPDGLVFTNHHCGFEAIRSHSTTEHDYMLDGFISADFSEELPCKNMFVSFMVEQKDLTSYLDSLGVFSMMPSEQASFVDSIENVLSKDVRERDSTLRLEIKPFYEGNKYYATTYRDFYDLRLVFAIPKSMGKFGGETDNWMWPRQTCDFSVFRIYADPETGGPATYNEANVPYKPETWAPISMEGYEPGSFSMIMGYPGSTSRYLSSYGIRERRDAKNEPRAQVRGVKQEVMLRHMQADEAVRIKYDSKYASSSNYWKNSIGMNKCIDSTGLIAAKAQHEARIKAYQEETGYLKDELDFDLMQRLYDERLNLVKTMTLFSETFFGTNELSRRAMKIHNGMMVNGPEKRKKKQYVLFNDNSDEWDEALDKDVLATLLKNYREQADTAYLPDFYKVIDSDFGGDYKVFVDHVWDSSILMRSNEKIYINKKSFLKDYGVQMGLDLTAIMGALKVELEASADSIKLLERYLCDAKIRMEMDMPHYSDANFTLRLSYGQVGGYDLAGRPSGYYTDSESILEKMKRGEDNPDYYAEPIMHELLGAPFGPYTDKRTGKMHLCFLTNNDITGGNSGSPMFNGKGELIGLAFDGNWDSLSGDIFFDNHLARTIGVDIRFVIYMMDKWGKADRLLREIGL